MSYIQVDQRPPGLKVVKGEPKTMFLSGIDQKGSVKITETCQYRGKDEQEFISGFIGKKRVWLVRVM